MHLPSEYFGVELFGSRYFIGVNLKMNDTGQNLSPAGRVGTMGILICASCSRNDTRYLSKQRYLNNRLPEYLPSFAFQVVGCSKGQGLNGGCRVDTGACGEDTSVNYEQVGDVMGSSPAVDNGGFGIFSHTGSPQ